MTIEIVRRPTNGITLEVAEAGPPDGPAVLLLHGFPENWYGWHRQIGPLAEAGYRVLAPNQRGYGGSDKPRGVASYRLATLVADAVGLLDGLGVRQAGVVGHDWGGIVTWGAIARHPDRFTRAVILNAPHPGAMLRAVREDRRQLFKSWYTFAFQIPDLPERLLARRDFAPLANGMVKSSRPGTFAEADLAIYRSSWGHPGAMRAMLAWYRAGFRYRNDAAGSEIISTPTKILWGVRDRFIGADVARASYAQCKVADLEWFDDATHWLHHEEADRVNRAILDHLIGLG